MIDKTVVKELDLEKYLGAWNEIARFDHSFERGLVSVTATYSYRKGGKIMVENAGYKGTLDGDKFVTLFSKARNLKGRLIGRIESLGFDLRHKVLLDILTLDVLKSSHEVLIFTTN